MSNEPIEVAEEALEKKIEEMKIVVENNKETEGKNGSPKKSERRQRVFMSDEERLKLWEEERKLKKEVETGVSGIVKWYSVLGHYGFIQRLDGKPDVFVHQSAITKSSTIKYYLRTLGESEAVEFDILSGPKGLEAANVTGPGGAEVKGSRYRRYLLIRKSFLRRAAVKKDKVDGDESGSVKDKSEHRLSKSKNRYRRGPRPAAGVEKESINDAAGGDQMKKADTSPTIGAQERKTDKKRHRRYHRQPKSESKNSEEEKSETGERRRRGSYSEAKSIPYDREAKHGVRRRKESSSSPQQTENVCGSPIAPIELGASAIDAEI